MRIFLESMWDRKRSENWTLSCSRSTISCLSRIRIFVGTSAVAVAMRRLWPARHPSPRKSPLLSSPTTASLPPLDTTDSFTAPRLMNITLVPAITLREDGSAGLVIRGVAGDTRRLEEVVCTDHCVAFFASSPWGFLRAGVSPAGRTSDVATGPITRIGVGWSGD